MKKQKPVRVEVIDREQRDGFLADTHIVKTVIPYEDKPVLITYEMTQAQLDDFVEGYDYFAEFIVSIERKVQ